MVRLRHSIVAPEQQNAVGHCRQDGRQPLPLILDDGEQLAQAAGHQIEVLCQRGDLLVGRDARLNIEVAAGQARSHAA